MELFQRIKELAVKCAGSETKLALALGLAQSRFNKYMNTKSQRNLWEYLPKILRLYPQLSRDWLYFGEGEMLKSKGEPEGEKKSEKPQHNLDEGIVHMPPVSVVGLASCGVQGMEQVMPYAVTVSPLQFSPRAVAVLASGESMVPAGIASGHVCYCDPAQKPLPGEAVFLQQKDGLGALKLFLGPGEQEGHTSFKGWLPARNGGRREFIMEIPNDLIDTIATVILVRRRL